MNKYEETLQELQKEFIREKDIIVVYLFGSVARGDFSERHSDMDLFIVINKKNLSEKLKEKINSRILPLGTAHGVRIHPEYQGIKIKAEDQSLVRKMIEEGKIIYSSGVFNFLHDQIGLKQYIIYSYSLKKSKNKTLFSKAVHGRKSWYYSGKEKIVKEYKGIADKEDIIPLGRGDIMVAKKRQKDIEILFKRFNIDYQIKRIVYG